MGEWNDAHKTSENIYELMKKVSKKQTDQQLKDLYIEFFGHLSHIFWESELYLFHTYALHNMQYLIKSSKGQSAISDIVKKKWTELRDQTGNQYM